MIYESIEGLYLILIYLQEIIDIVQFSKKQWKVSTYM